MVSKCFEGDFGYHLNFWNCDLDMVSSLDFDKNTKKELIKSGTYSLVKHRLCTGGALLALPWNGFLFNPWLGVLIGIMAKNIFDRKRKYYQRLFGQIGMNAAVM